MNVADQKDLYEDLDVLHEIIDIHEGDADRLIRVLEALADATPQLADLRRQTVRRWLRDQARPTLDRGTPKGLPHTPVRVAGDPALFNRQHHTGTMITNELTGETWFE